jgi:uncharacterized protein (DUF952 family)
VTAPPRVFHLTTPAEWAEARRAGRLVPQGFADEGFVHCSTLAQLVGTIERHLSGVDELAVLELDLDRLGGDLRWEESRPGERYPHLYRPLEAGDVIASFTWHRGPDGGVELPEGLR